MTVLLLILCSVACVGLGAWLIYYFLKYSETGGSWQDLFHWAVSISRRKYPVELYVWKISNDENVCEDCLDRASWEPMDIADWMKEGLPGTHEADTECGDKCRCKLVLYNPRPARHRDHSS